MKKYLTAKTLFTLLLALVMVFTLCACTAPAIEVPTQNPDGSQTLAAIVIEQVVNIVFRAIEAAVMIFAAWALKKFGNNKNMQSLSIAIQLVCDMTIQTAGELQQTIVADLKKARPGGKLTPADVDDLAYRLFNMTKAKLSDATKELVIASGADLDAIITGACEDILAHWKGAFIEGELLVSNEGETESEPNPEEDHLSGDLSY